MNDLNVGGVYYRVDLDTSRMLRQSREADSALRGVEFRMGAVALAVKSLAAALALLKMAKVADEVRLLAARVEVAAGSVDRGADAMAQLARVSARTQTGLEANVQVFTRLNASILQLGGTQQDTLRITELLAMAIKVSGASASEAASAMTQFGQALGSGQLQGDELRSLLENAPYLMRQLAAGIGVPVGALKELGEQGKLTADVVTAALTRAAGQIAEDFGRLPRTFDAAMLALVDQLRAASAAADTLSGTSAALTGVATGAAEAVEMLADQLKGAAGAADGLGRNNAISEWSRRTTLVLSYVADAADLTWQTLSVLGRNVAFVFQGVGREIGGIGAQIAALARGDLSGARAIGAQLRADAEAARAALDAADARTLGGRQLAGQAMRERLAALASADGSGYMDRSDRLALGKPSALRGSGGSGGTGAGRGARGETEAAIKARQDLARIARVDAAEQEADRQARDAAARAEEDARRAAQERAAGATLAQGIVAGTDPLAQLQLDLERRSALLAEYAAKDQENAELYAQAKVALEQQTAAQIQDILARQESERMAAQSQFLQAYSGLFGGMAELLGQFEGEQSSAYKAMFVASKAFAIADSIVKIQQGIANSLALPYPANIAAAAQTAATATGLIQTIKGTNYGGGRRYGGPVDAGSLYRINEAGAPEMFVGSGGRQYMLPTARGEVVPAGEVGRGGAVNVTVHNYSGHPVDVRQGAYGHDVEVIVGRAVAEVAGGIATNSGPVFRALTTATNLRPKL